MSGASVAKSEEYMGLSDINVIACSGAKNCNRKKPFCPTSTIKKFLFTIYRKTCYLLFRPVISYFLGDNISAIAFS